MKSLTRKITGILLITIAIAWHSYIGVFFTFYQFNEWATRLLTVPAVYCMLSFLSLSKQSQKKRAIFNIIGVVILLLLILFEKGNFLPLKALRMLATLMGLVIVLIVHKYVQKDNTTASWLSYFDWQPQTSSDTKQKDACAN